MSASDQPDHIAYVHYDALWYRIFWHSVWGTVTVFYISSALVFHQYRKEWVIRYRSPGLTYLQMVAGYFFLSVHYLEAVMHDLPCFVIMWANNICTLLFLFAMMLRTLRLHMEQQAFQQKLEALAQQATARRLSEAARIRKAQVPHSARFLGFLRSAKLLPESVPSLALNGGSKEDINECRKTEEKEKGITNIAQSQQLSPSEGGPKPYGLEATQRNLLGDDSHGIYGVTYTQRDKRHMMEVNWYLRQRAKYIDRRIGQTFVIGVASTFMATCIIQVVTKERRMWPVVDKGCVDNGWEFCLAWVAGAGFFGFVAPYMLWKLRRAADPAGVQLDVYFSFIVGVPSMFASFLWFNFISPKFGLPFRLGSLFLMMLPVVLHVMSVVWPVVKCRRWLKERRRRRLGMNMAGLEWVMRNVGMAVEFEEWCLKESCIELFIFLSEYRQLQRQARNILLPPLLATPNEEENHHPLSSVFLRLSHRHFAKHSPAPTPFAQQSTYFACHNRGPTGLTAAPSLQAVSGVVGLATKGRPSHDIMQLFPTLPVPESLETLWIGFYEMFIKTDSPIALNLPHDIVNEVADMVACRQLTVGMFDRCRESVFNSLFLNSYPSFLHHMRERGYYLAPDADSAPSSSTTNSDVTHAGAMC
ncbi:hypothetical protein HDU85_003724 [Gaertneriomyces sp. JEL0708]|nr:hypothetical protein HDU85_003724 [Gaertneriomyces sp. JEL0708]